MKNMLTVTLLSAFLITLAFAPDAAKMGVSFVEAAQAAGVRKVVYNSVYHPSLPLENHVSTRPVEAALYASALDFTILQPAMYMQGLDGAFEQALRTGTLVMPWSKHSEMTYVDYRDVAEAAALAFTGERLSRGTFELAGPGMVDRIRLAELMTTASGREVTAVDLPAGFTLPPGQPGGLSAMFVEYDQHGFHGGNSLVLRAIHLYGYLAQRLDTRLGPPGVLSVSPTRNWWSLADGPTVWSRFQGDSSFIDAR